jgi:predicted RNase H-like HicB family nuclease
MANQAKTNEYLVVYEKTPTGFSAYVPDLPGCISTGPTLQDTKTNMQEAIRGHLSVMREFATPFRSRPQPPNPCRCRHNSFAQLVPAMSQAPKIGEQQWKSY